MRLTLFLIFATTAVLGFTAGACLRIRMERAVEAAASPEGSRRESPGPDAIDVVALRRSMEVRIARQEDPQKSGDWICWYPLDVDEREPRPAAFESGLFR